MPYVKVGEENSGDIELYYEDHGSGDAIVLIHGFPLNGASWERQVPTLLDAGYRVIWYDRRGFGRSSQPTVGYDYDTFAADLDALMTKLDLSDAVLAGFSMGTGEVTRYLGRYGSARVRKAALLGAIPPFLLQTDDNPAGVPKAVFDGIQKAIVADRPAYFTAFLHEFNNVDVYGGTRISDDALHQQWSVAVGSSAIGTLRCVDSWLTDFRDDLPKIDVPLLLVHGTADRILPFAATAERLPPLLKELGKDLTYTFVQDGPHNIGWTHPEEVNAALRDFLTS